MLGEVVVNAEIRQSNALREAQGPIRGGPNDIHLLECYIQSERESSDSG